MDKTVIKAVSFEEQKADGVSLLAVRQSNGAGGAAWDMILSASQAKGTLKMDKNWIDLLSQFDQHDVRYPTVGGWAVTFHSQSRFNKAWLGRVDAEQQEIPVHYLGKQDLIKNKQASARLQDLADAEAVQSAERALYHAVTEKS